MSHTFTGKSWSIHYNPDLSGEVVLSRKYCCDVKIDGDDVRGFIEQLSPAHHDRERERRDRWCQFMAAAIGSDAFVAGRHLSLVATDCVALADEALEFFDIRFPLEEPDKE